MPPRWLRAFPRRTGFAGRRQTGWRSGAETASQLGPKHSVRDNPAMKPAALLFALALMAPAAWAQDKPVYKCPGPPVLYTDAITAQEARDRGCRTIEGTPITVIPAPARRPAAARPASAAPASAGERIDTAEQRARDSDRRRILSDELRAEEARLVELRREFNNGEPERRGDERNYQRYLDRVAELRAAILRKEGDVAALRRELGKLPPS
jgi:hypothetical protein